MKYRDKYSQCEAWFEKVSVMSIFHLTMCNRDKTWTVRDTAQYFGVSAGLVSENLKLAKHMSTNAQLKDEVSRQAALKKVKVVE